ncbi:MAG: hypothetical protein ACRD2L_10490 [Terriglobia bacterium]
MSRLSIKQSEQYRGGHRRLNLAAGLTPAKGNRDRGAGFIEDECGEDENNC